MADRAANGQILPGAVLNPTGKNEPKTPLAVFRRMLRREPLPGELDRMIEAFDIPEDVAAELRQCKNGLEAMVMLAMHRAHSGSWDAWREIMDRVAPKPKAVEVSGPGGAPIQSVGAIVTAQVSQGDAARQYADLLLGAVVEQVFEDEDEPEPVDPLLL